MNQEEWDEDELILVLDAYLNEDTNAYEEEEQVGELSQIMDRSKGSIALRIANYKHLNPFDDTEGMENGGKHCEKVWKKYRDQKHKLKERAEEIKEKFRKENES